MKHLVLSIHNINDLNILLEKRIDELVQMNTEAAFKKIRQLQGLRTRLLEERDRKARREWRAQERQKRANALQLNDGQTQTEGSAEVKAEGHADEAGATDKDAVRKANNKYKSIADRDERIKAAIIKSAIAGVTTAATSPTEKSRS